MDQHLLSIILFAPLAGMLVLLLIPSSSKNLIKLWANLVGFACFLISLPLASRFDKSIAGYQMIERADWIPSLGAKYLVGVDGISLLLVMLTTVISFLAILSSWNAIEDRLKERSEEHTSELQSPDHLVCRLLLEKNKKHCDR